MKKTRSFRVEQEILEKISAMGIDANQIVAAALAKATKDTRCPYCNQKIKPKKGE